MDEVLLAKCFECAYGAVSARNAEATLTGATQMGREEASHEALRACNIASNHLTLWRLGLQQGELFSGAFLEAMKMVPELKEYALALEQQAQEKKEKRKRVSTVCSTERRDGQHADRPKRRCTARVHASTAATGDDDDDGVSYATSESDGDAPSAASESSDEEGGRVCELPRAHRVPLDVHRQPSDGSVMQMPDPTSTAMSAPTSMPVSLRPEQRVAQPQLVDRVSVADGAEGDSGEESAKDVRVIDQDEAAGLLEALEAGNADAGDVDLDVDAVLSGPHENSNLDFLAAVAHTCNVAQELQQHLDDSGPSECLLRCVLAEQSGARSETLVVRRAMIGIATADEERVLPYATAMMRCDRKIVGLPPVPNPTVKARITKTTPSAAVQSQGALTAPIKGVLCTSKITLAQLKAAHPEFVRKYEPLIVERSKEAAVRFDARRASDKRPTKYYIQHTVYDRALSRQSQARHGQFFDKSVAELFATWLMEQLREWRATPNVARAFCDLLMPAALTTRDLGKPIDLRRDASGAWRLQVASVVRPVDWGTDNVPTRPLSGTLSKQQSQKALLSGAMQNVLVVGGGGDTNFCNPLALEKPEYDEAFAALRASLYENLSSPGAEAVRPSYLPHDSIHPTGQETSAA